MTINWDAYLNIDSQATIYYDRTSRHYDDYFESEPTAYQDLQYLVDHYQPQVTAPHLIDVGCGTGRTLCFLHHHYQIPATGIEYHPAIYQLCQNNIQSYMSKHPSSATIQIFKQAAERFDFQKEHTIFYFFNPFSPAIFRQLVGKLTRSFGDYPREMEIILYYPQDDIVNLFNYFSPFRRVQSIDLPWYEDQTDRFDLFKSPSLSLKSSRTLIIN